MWDAVKEEYLVEELHRGVDDLEFQELLSEVLDPEVDGACIEVAQKENRDQEDADADHVEELVPLEPAGSLVVLLAHQAAHSTHEPDRQKREGCLQIGT